MAEATLIQWATSTFNPWIGCTKVSSGCRNCYADAQDGRFGWTADGWGEGKPRTRTSPAYWRKPFQWDQKAKSSKVDGHGWRVFCASLADVFDEEVSDDWRDDLFYLIAATPNLSWLLLTKRPAKMQAYIGELRAGKRHIISRKVYRGAQAWGHEGGIADAYVVKHAFDRGWSNVWLGVSVEDQATADERIPILLDTPAAVRFVSYEPALGPITFRDEWLIGRVNDRQRWESGGLDWIIVGGESGPRARLFDIAWARSTISQCRKAGVACFVKQLGARPMGIQRYGVVWRDWPRDSKGGDPAEWPEDLRVQEFPR